MADFPADVLRQIFGRVLAGPSDLSGPTLHCLAGQWFILRNVCRHWAAVLLQTPVCVDIEAASPAALSWLATVPVALLRIGRFGPHFRDRRSKSAPLLDKRLEDQLQLGTGSRGGRSAPASGEFVTSAALIEALSDPSSNSRLSHWWSSANLSLLQLLHLKGSLSPSGEPASFAAAPLSGLASLTHLHLERFTHFDLTGLPPLLRVLKLRYQEAPMFSSHPHPSLDVVRLPPTARLSLLEVDSRASLGMLAGELAAQCSTLVVRATRAYVGVPGPFSREDLADFHELGGRRAHEEGLRHKAELMAATARQFLLLLAQGGAGGSTGGIVPGSWSDGGGQGPGSSSSSGRGDARASLERAPGASRLSSIEFRWMCADTLVFVPLPEAEVSMAHAASSGSGPSGSHGVEQALVALESAQAAVHEGEEPVVEISAAHLAELVQQLQEEQQRQAREGPGQEQQPQHRGTVCVDVGRGAGHQQAMLLRLSAVEVQ